MLAHFIILKGTTAREILIMMKVTVLAPVTVFDISAAPERGGSLSLPQGVYTLREVLKNPYGGLLPLWKTRYKKLWVGLVQTVWEKHANDGKVLLEKK